MIEISLKSNKKTELIDLTQKIQKIVQESQIQNGLCIVFNPHTTAGITINEGFDLNVEKDILNKLNELIPENHNFLHLEGNSDAHIKASLIGASETIIIKNNKLFLGEWQKIFFCEFDGTRNRKILIKLIKSD